MTEKIEDVREDIGIDEEAPITIVTKIEPPPITQSTLGNKNAIVGTNETTNIKFRFKWEYAIITKLTDEELVQINRTRHYHGKRYRKPCSLCAEEGTIEYRKTSGGNSLLICKECAENYAQRANQLVKMGFEF